jgi:hypothetical protein
MLQHGVRVFCNRSLEDRGEARVGCRGVLEDDARQDNVQDFRAHKLALLERVDQNVHAKGADLVHGAVAESFAKEVKYVSILCFSKEVRKHAFKAASVHAPGRGASTSMTPS